MKTMWLCAVIGILLVGGCNYSSYDSGYESAWEDEELPWWASDEAKAGYEDGLDDIDLYDEGYQDSLNKRKPYHYNEYYYMEGYKDGKKHR